jgi:hypothetical protein
MQSDASALPGEVESLRRKGIAPSQYAGANIDHDHFRSFRSEVINVIENSKLARDRTENRYPFFLITRPAKVFKLWRDLL